ncbi:MAG: DUF1800 domain-containing protein [Bacteroidota bacterium]
MVNTINPYQPSDSKPWNAQRVQHLYNRFGFGADWATLQAALSQSPIDVVNQLIDSALALSAPEVPYWALWTYDDYPDEETYFQEKSLFFQRWVSEMAVEGPRSKMALFWHNHFVTREEDYDCNAYMWSYYALLHQYAFGNFRTFVEEMGLNPAMLIFLNGNFNIASEPNENYARELLELFTMGESNGYSQNDIVEVARALTGWQINMYACETAPFFNPNLHDQTSKTIFGQTGNWNYQDVHELIFTLRSDQVATFICEKLYRFFVYEKVDPIIVESLATTFKNNNWEIAPVLRQLLSSEHFFEERFINARIKSPLEAGVSVIKLTGGALESNYNQDLIGYLTFIASSLGQEVFNPIDVAGWQEHQTWLSENTLTGRWSFCTNILYSMYGFSGDMRSKLHALTRNLVGPTEADVRVVTEALVQYFLNTPLDEPLFEVALLYFKGEVPENYFEDGTWSVNYNQVPEQTLNLFIYLMRLPEWQLC